MIKWLDETAKVSYSQSGEDRIVSYIFDWIGLKTPTYLDVGAHHASHLSNTYLFYKKGSTGVCIEPNPDLFNKLSKKRSRDVCLNIGIAHANQQIADFYILTANTLSTFSKEDAMQCQDTKNYGNQKIEKVIQIPLKNINDVMVEYFPNGVNFISIDVEGLDAEIIFSFDFSKYQPDVFCIETLRYDSAGVLEKNIDIINYMKSKEYFVYGETYINTIFVSKKVKGLLV